MFSVSNAESLIRDEDSFLPSDSSNTPNFYSTSQGRFSGNKAAGADPNCGAIAVILTRQECFFYKELARKITKSDLKMAALMFTVEKTTRFMA